MSGCTSKPRRNGSHKEGDIVKTVLILMDILNRRYLNFYGRLGRLEQLGWLGC